MTHRAVVFALLFTFSPIAFGSKVLPGGSIPCSTKTDSDHPFYGSLKSFVDGRGCAVQGVPLGSELLLDPYFVITKLNAEDLAPQDPPFDISIFNLSSPVRTILENLDFRDDVIMIISPIKNNRGSVIHEKTDPQILKKIKDQFAFMPNISKVKMLFVLGNSTSPRVAIHENHHIEDLTAGRLPISNDKVNQLGEALSSLISSGVDVSEGEIQLVKKWIFSMTRSAPEIAAIQAEHKYFTDQGKISNSFLEYLSESELIHVNGPEGVGWLNESWKSDATSEFLKQAMTKSCLLLKDILLTLEVHYFEQIFPICTYGANVGTPSKKIDMGAKPGN